MKIYKLCIDDKLMGLCKDKFLLELFIVQRKYMKHKYEITKIISKNSGIYDLDYYMIYYYGYAITNYEYRYLYNVTKELDENRKFNITKLEVTLRDKSLTKKERKTIKRTIKILKSHKMEDDDEITSNMNDIINNPYCVKDYLDMLDSFHSAIENDDIHLEKG